MKSNQPRFTTTNSSLYNIFLQAKLRTASSVKEEEEDQPHHQEVPRETDDNVFVNQ